MKTAASRLTHALLASLALAAVATPVLAPTAAHAQRSQAKIVGRVVEQGTNKPLAGVTVTVTSPNLQGEMTEFTNEDGQYTITELPAGTYLVRFYFADIVTERPNVRLDAGTTLPINVALGTDKAKTVTVTLTDRAPAVDVGSARQRTVVDADFIKNTPVRGRTFESILTTAPTAAGDDVGVSFGGSTSPENQYLIDGLSTTNAGYGLIGTPLSAEFLNQAELILAGYNAEFGRATGGIVSVTTKSGTNEFKGEVWMNWVPGQLDPKVVGRFGEAVVRQSRPNDLGADIGFTLGGPIVKDRVWFFVGLSPNFEQQRYSRFLRRRTANNVPAGLTTAYAGDTLTGDAATAACPDYIRSRDPALCVADRGAFVTEDIAGTEKDFVSRSWTWNYMAKIDARISDDHRISVTYIGTPSTFDGYFDNPRNPNSLGLGFNNDMASTNFAENIWVHDVIGRLNSKFFDRKLQLDAFVGLHHETYDVIPGVESQRIIDLRTRNLASFEPIAACAPQVLANGTVFNPCPVANYGYGGFGFANNIAATTFNTGATLTYLLDLLGTHELKAGGDLQIAMFDNLRRYTSTGPNGGVYQIDSQGRARRQEFTTIDPDTGEAQYTPQGFQAITETWRQAFFLRDAWRMSFAPGLSLEPGIRWEREQLRNTEGLTRLSFNENFAPRIGLTYDFTQKGYSRLYANYGQYFEATPLGINDRAFAREGLSNGARIRNTCPTDPSGRVDVNNCNFPALTPSALFGGEEASVSPVLRSQFQHEVVAGFEYNLFSDLVLGVNYTHRQLGRVVEDASADGANTYLIMNPGDAIDPATEAKLQDDIAAATTDEAREKAETALKTYRAQSIFPRPRRVYNALTFTANKRFGENWSLQASWTWSRTVGNYPGLYQSSNGQLDPNISTAYDLRDLVLNRDGPLPSDRPHIIRLFGTYVLPLNEKKTSQLTFGAGIRAESGVPIEVLGNNPYYGRNETFILPRGAGGRTPMLANVDLRVAYRWEQFEFSADVFNVFNFRGVAAVDNEYTTDFVRPIVNGSLADLKSLKTDDGSAVRPNPNYGQPTAFQRPLFARLGIRMYF